MIELVATRRHRLGDDWTPEDEAIIWNRMECLRIVAHDTTDALLLSAQVCIGDYARRMVLAAMSPHQPPDGAIREY